MARTTFRADKASTLILSCICFLSWGICAQISSQSEEPVSKWLEQARGHLEEFEYEAALTLYEKILQEQPQHFEALCGASYSGGMVGKFRGEEERKAFYQRSYERARQAHELDPEHAESNFAMAWALGGQAMLAGAREKVKLAEEMRGYLREALDRHPEDHRAWYLLGGWRYRIATAGFLERTAANVFFGGLPEEGDLESAVEAYRKAVELCPQSILYRYELARALQAAGQELEALQHYEKAVQLRPRTPEDPTLLARCRYQAEQLR